ncbi:hypothetical protein Tco_1455185, partial [Tanacetum coccineum]
ANPADTFTFVSGHTYQSWSIEEVMTDKGKKSSIETFAPNDKADYYSGITSITINGKNAYELKGKFLDDLHNNAFSGPNRKDIIEHIEYYLKIIDPIKLPNVDHDKLRIVVFPISLAGGARRWFDRTKESRLHEHFPLASSCLVLVVNIFKLLCGHGRWEIPLDKGLLRRSQVLIVHGASLSTHPGASIFPQFAYCSVVRVSTSTPAMVPADIEFRREIMKFTN